MEWLYSLFLEHSALQAVVVLSLISAVGLGLGRVHFWGVSLGVTFVFFTGILAGHLGLSVDPQMLNYAESFGLVIFVYSLGLQVLPFISTFPIFINQPPKSPIINIISYFALNDNIYSLCGNLINSYKQTLFAAVLYLQKRFIDLD